MKVIYILFQDIGWDMGEKFIAAYKDTPAKDEVQNKTMQFLTDSEYSQLCDGNVVHRDGGFIELQQYTLK